MVAFILFVLATAGVKGFAFVLGVGTIVSFLTAVLLTQAVLGALGRSRLISHPAALGASSTRQRFRWDFMGRSKYFFALSGVILLVGALAVGGKGLNLGIDFTSGTRVIAELNQKTDDQGVRDALDPIGLGKAKIQQISGKEFASGQAFQISTDTLTRRERTQAEQALNQKFGGGTYSFQTIGPTFGNTVAKSAIIAIIASLIVISSYIALRFEWKYAVPVLIALMHDLLITAGVYALFGLEVTTATVAALLTIVGFSLYDTIIVFDRIRENVPRMPRAAFSQIINRSMSEVLMRSLATSLSTLLPILCLLFFGGETLKDFAFALAIGVLSGTYSSIFIASPVLMHWKEGEGVWRARRRRVAAANGGHVPPYATAAGGAATEVEIGEQKPRTRLTAPQDPDAGQPDRVRRDGPRAARSAGGTATARRTRTSRRHRRRRVMSRRPAARGPRAQGRAAAQTQATAQQAPREAIAMGLLAWAMMGIAIWHFAIFIPDRFWAGVVGSFLFALVGAVIVGLRRLGLRHPGRGRDRIATALEAIPGALLGLGFAYWLGVRQGNERRALASSSPSSRAARRSRRRALDVACWLRIRPREPSRTVACRTARGAYAQLDRAAGALQRASAAARRRAFRPVRRLGCARRSRGLTFPPRRSAVRALERELGVSSALAQVLVRRGLGDAGGGAGVHGGRASA